MATDSFSNAETGLYVVYNCENKTFAYPQAINEVFNARFDLRPLWQIMTEDNVAPAAAVFELRKAIEAASLSDKPTVNFLNCFLMCADKQMRNYNLGVICTAPRTDIFITFNRCNTYNSRSRLYLQGNKLDELTGILRHGAFADEIATALLKLSDDDLGKYMLIYFDVQRFKIINDMFGIAEGDRLLIHIANVISEFVKDIGICCRIGSDRFALFLPISEAGPDAQIEELLSSIEAYSLPFEITCNAGIYIINDKTLSAVATIDRAILAQSSIKGSYTKRYNYYNEDLRRILLTEQEITGMMRTALEEEQFVVYYQPQYNHSTGMLVGAEALVRWLHPEKGLIPPINFIPIFEKNGFITQLDLYVFERVCRFIRKCLDRKLPVVPISTNLTRYDIFSPNFIEGLEEARQKYNVPSRYIRVEITESAALGNSQFINEAVRKLHRYGFIVEMDDFGSGYSSLNILKDIDFDMIKLDMKFLQSDDNDNNGRGGTILSSVVRMVNWLSLPIIAEGVETVKQADYLRSIGCDYIQGYLYAKPLPEDQYTQLLSNSFIGSTSSQLHLIETLNTDNFWSYDSLETLIFSNFVGGAAIFDYSNNKIELLRINKKYLKELGMNLSEKDLINSNALDTLDEENKKIYTAMLKQAIETGEEQECETWRDMSSPCCGNERICIRSTVRMIGKNKDNYLFYAMIRNITSERQHYLDVLDNERRFKAVTEQANIYYWEYNVATKEMRPCFRCMRDLGLPALLTNYPESAIEAGIFPPEVADMYRDWHKQIADGVPHLEAIMPLTVGRIPFHVRYTTEFDEFGRPVKAYGSATLVVD